LFQLWRSVLWSVDSQQMFTPQRCVKQSAIRFCSEGFTCLDNFQEVRKNFIGSSLTYIQTSEPTKQRIGLRAEGNSDLVLQDLDKRKRKRKKAS